MTLRRFGRQYEQLSQFERGRILGIMEAEWSSRRVSRHLGLTDYVVRRISGSERCHLHEGQARNALDRPVVEKTATSSDDNRVRVLRSRVERLNPDFVYSDTPFPQLV
ncbi:transposable element Tcb1 transposase [Trichonephila clavipes]|nr:transposable element Tcb1 transposase [Trichonephila clavipes]